MACLYQMVKKFEDMFIRFDRIHERDRHRDTNTDGRTPHDDIGRACIASRGKNCARGIVLLKLTTDRHEASCGLAATAELLVGQLLR